MTHPPPNLESADCVFNGKRIQVYVTHPSKNDPHPYTKEMVVHPGAAVILPILNEKEIIMIRNERFVVQDVLWEIPAGTLEPHEEPLKAAERELIEETGYRAHRMELLFSYYPSPGFCNEYMHIFCAYDLEHLGQQHLDPTEKIEFVPMPWDQALEMIRTGEIIDGKTIASLLFYNTWKKNLSH